MRYLPPIPVVFFSGWYSESASTSPLLAPCECFRKVSIVFSFFAKKKPETRFRNVRTPLTTQTHPIA